MITSQHQYTLLAPNIFGFKGGIQTYTTFFLQGLQLIDPQAKYQVLLKYDRSCPENHQFLPQTEFHGFGRFPRWLQSCLMTFTMVQLAIENPSLTFICTHVNYSWICYYLKRLFKVRYWVIAHGLEVWDLKSVQLQKALHNADKIIAVSNYTRDRLIQEQNLDFKPVIVVPNTFDPTQFQIAPKPEYLLDRYNLTAKQPIILSVTRLGKSARYKGYDQILQALGLIRQSFPSIHYILVGKGDDTPRIKDLIKHLGLEYNVTLTGFVSDQELCDHYNLCDVFALPSQGEGFGIVYLEALACGKPVLAGNQDGAVDPLLGGELGCLVDPTDVKAIALNLLQILQGIYPNPILYKPQQLRKNVIKQFGIESFQSNLRQIMNIFPVHI
ncbi:conserved hypothetical protein [Planktothrix sp. PCC 11201]|uniref:glycosyltransferase n=1 Tax=Planktothrix sp. PCC 11201 TaxID=1729650 RepID=UPI00091563EE|nr:glycosyltransferase [Planktothrix sp. PCC 11201]SKB14240.1 conserved hypothetical protein [Planktothrix sp. PCC 11201]